MPDTSGGKVTSIPLGIIARATGAVRAAISGASEAWFGPGQPTRPLAPPDTKGRQLDYPYGYNLPSTPRAGENVDFNTMRAMADALPLLRLAIETRKDQVQNIRWTVRLRDAKKAKQSRSEGKEDPRIQMIKDFLVYPDREHDFTTWMRMLLEEMLVVDAACIYPRFTNGGAPYSLELLDGATIKRLIDAGGRTPEPPNPAYQQFLHGVPVGDFTRAELLYLPRNVRVNRFYGYSPVEQLIMTVEIALRRELFTMNYYKEGSVPDAIASVPKEWTTEQVKEFQTYWDYLLTGNLAERRKMRFVPGGSDFKFEQLKEPPLKDMYDEWLARVICYCLSVSVSPLVSQVNRATGETMRVQASEEGLSPSLIWTKSFMDRIIWGCFKFYDLEFAWETENKEDILRQSQADEIDAKSAIRTLDQIREDRGLEPYNIKGVTDAPMLLTATGPVPLREAVEKAKEDILNPPEPMFPQLGPDGKPMPPKPGDKATDDKKSPVVGQEVGKLAKGPFSGEVQIVRRADGLHKRLPSLLHSRPVVMRAERKLRKVLAAGLFRLARDVAGQVKRDLMKVEETNAQRAARIARELDLGGLRFVVDATERELAAVAADSSVSVLSIMGAQDHSQLVNRVNTVAADWAHERAAEMVGMRWGEDGELLPAVRAEYRIDETTRDGIQRTIFEGLEENVGVDEIIEDLQDSFDFSAQRAEAIARTEITRANNEGSLIGAREARDELGLGLKKVWLTAENEQVCDICMDNQDAGPIDIDEEFPSGDDAPPGHPSCHCTLTYEVNEDASAD